MSIFLPFKGLSTKLDGQVKIDGQLLFTEDDEKLYIDHKSDEGEVDRSCINPNPDWNAESGNSFIRNKPTYVSSVIIAGENLVVNYSNNTQKEFTVTEVFEYPAANGHFVRIGNSCQYTLTREIEIPVITAHQVIVIDQIPEDIMPRFKTYNIAITDKAQLSDSLLIVFDPELPYVTVVNRSNDIIRNITVLQNTTSYIVAGYVKSTEISTYVRAVTSTEMTSLFDDSIDTSNVEEAPNRVSDEDIASLFTNNNIVNIDEVPSLPDAATEDDILKLFDVEDDDS